MHQIRFRLGLRPAGAPPQTSQLHLRGPTSKGRAGEGRERERRAQEWRWQGRKGKRGKLQVRRSISCLQAPKTYTVGLVTPLPIPQSLVSRVETKTKVSRPHQCQAVVKITDTHNSTHTISKIQQRGLKCVSAFS